MGKKTENTLTKNVIVTPEGVKKEKNPEDSNTWEVGDIIAGTTCFYGIMPRFYKIIKRTAKMFTVIRLRGKVVSGHRNGHYEEVATDEPYDNKEKRVRITNSWIKIDYVTLGLWDGNPLYGDDLD